MDWYINFLMSYGIIKGFILPIVLIGFVFAFSIRKSLKKTPLGRLSGKRQLILGLIIFSSAAIHLYADFEGKGPSFLDNIKKDLSIFPKDKITIELSEEEGILDRCFNRPGPTIGLVINSKEYSLPYGTCISVTPIMKKQLIFFIDKNNIIWQISRANGSIFVKKSETRYERYREKGYEELVSQATITAKKGKLFKRRADKGYSTDTEAPILGFYGLGEGTIVRTEKKLLFAKVGKFIEVKGTQFYDGKWKVKKAFPYKNPDEQKRLYGYYIDIKWRGYPPGWNRRIPPEPNPSYMIPHTGEL